MDTFQVDWDGYTIGYYGRIFEARNKTKGGSFVVCNRKPIVVKKSFFRGLILPVLLYAGG